MHYRPADSMRAPRFTGVRTFMRLPAVPTLDDVDAVVVGVPTDSAVSFRSGARFGPAAIRDASILLRDYNKALDVNVPKTLSMVDYGDAPTVPGYHEETLRRVEEFLRPIYDRDVVPMILGGDHSLVMAEFRALAGALGGPFAVVHFDAHADVLDDYYGVKHFHGTMFRRGVEEGLIDPSRSVQVGMRGTLHPGDEAAGASLGYQVFWYDDLVTMTPAAFGEAVRRRVGDMPVLVSFDIDFIDPAYAPGTGTPEVAGPSSHEALAYLRALGPLDYRSFDLVEVSPPYDPAGVTSLVASVACFEMLSLLALRRRDRGAVVADTARRSS